MDTSIEDDVCMGPLSLNDIRRALEIFDPLRKSKRASPKAAMDSSPPELEDSIYPVNNGEMLPELENTMDNSLLELETVDFVNLCDESSNLSKEINISTFIHDDSEVICTSETADSFVLYKAMPKTQDPLACSEPKKNWDKLVHDITNKLNICDQTAPEYMHQTALESTMIPKSRKINSDAFNLTGYKQMKMGDDSLTVFEDIEREVQSPLKVSPQKKCAAQINCDNVSETSGITSVYETAQQSSASSLGSQSLKDVFESAHNSTGSSCDMSDMTDDHVLRSPLSNDFSADTSYSISPCVKDVLYKSKSCTKSTVKDDDSVKIIDQSDNSLEFDNTFDEMQYLMNANNKLKQKALDTPLKDNFSNGTITPERQAAPYPKFSPITPTSETSTPIGPPTTLLSAGRPKRTYYPARHAESDNQFRVPTLPSRKIHSPHNNQYSHIVSPIALYIKNSPKVPLVGKHVPNITGSKDLKSPSQKHVFRNKLVDEKENDGVIIGTPVLPTKAYKTSAYTALNNLKQSPNIPSSVNNYNKNKKLVQDSEQNIILHEKRLKNSKLPRLISVKTEESYANLSVSSAEVSVCVQKTPVRTETVIHKKND